MLAVQITNLVGVPYHLSNQETGVIEIVHGGLGVFLYQRSFGLHDVHELGEPNADRSVSNTITWLVIGYEPIRVVSYDVERRSRSYTMHFNVSFHLQRSGIGHSLN